MKQWWQSKSLWAAVIGIIAMAITLLTKGKITLGAEDQAQMVDMIVNAIGAIIPLISFIVIIIRKIIDLKNAAVEAIKKA